MTETMELMTVQQERPPSIFYDYEHFTKMMKIADSFCRSTFVPKRFQGKPADFLVAMEYGERINVHPVMILQSTYIVGGNVGVEGKFVAGIVNTCGRYDQLEYEVKKLGKVKVEARYLEYIGGKNTTKYRKIEIEDIECRAWTTKLSNGNKLVGSPVSIAMAARSGWYLKNDSPWKANPEQMLKYRAATYFGRAYCPELLLGMRNVEDLQDAKTRPEISTTNADEINADLDNDTVDNKAVGIEKRQINKIKDSLSLDKYRQSQYATWKSKYNEATLDALLTYCGNVYDNLKTEEGVRS